MCFWWGKNEDSLYFIKIFSCEDVLRRFAFPAWALVAAIVPSAFAATAYINQVGYRASDAKELTIADGNGKVEFVDASGKTVLSVDPGAASNWQPSGQNVQLVDFSDLKDAGTYSIKLNGQVLRDDLKITSKTFEDVMKASIKWFYYQRASMALENQYAGKWSRAAGHMDQNVQFHSSAGGQGSLNTPKGWYDAGDFGKYIVNSGITTYTLISLYEHFPEYFKAQKWSIPADGSLPDLLAEIKYNLDWMLTMQASDGGVYHKVSALGFPGDIMPAQDTDARYVIGKSTAASYDFAAVMAAASRVYKPFDASYASKCLEAAKKAFAWGNSNPNKTFSNPSDVSTGEYGDASLGDEKQFAGTELFIATGDASYKQSGGDGKVPSWWDVSGLAVYGKATHAAEFGGDANAAASTLTAQADEFVNRTKTGFGVVMANDDFVWGSNAVAANQGVWLLHAFYVTGEKKYYDAARKVLDYLLGKNPLNMSFVTGFGVKSPMMPHHRISTADNVTEPVPGMLVGGPQPAGEDVGSKAEWKCDDYRTGHAATSYTDERCSYATNEVAINWNAPLAYLAGAIEALNAGFAPSFSKGKIEAEQAATPTSSSSVNNQNNGNNPSSSSSANNQNSQNNNPVNPTSSSAGASSVDPASPNNPTNPNDPLSILKSEIGNVPAGTTTVLRVKNHKLYVEKNGKLYDLKGNKLSH